MDKQKVFVQTEIALKDQNIIISPNETWDWVIMKTMELDGKTHSTSTYLNESEIEVLIIKLREMMNYIKN
jgi:hypothetical protein